MEISEEEILYLIDFDYFSLGNEYNFQFDSSDSVKDESKDNIFIDFDENLDFSSPKENSEKTDKKEEHSFISETFSEDLFSLSRSSEDCNEILKLLKIATNQTCCESPDLFEDLCTSDPEKDLFEESFSYNNNLEESPDLFENDSDDDKKCNNSANLIMTSMDIDFTNLNVSGMDMETDEEEIKSIKDKLLFQEENLNAPNMVTDDEEVERIKDELICQEENLNTASMNTDDQEVEQINDEVQTRRENLIDSIQELIVSLVESFNESGNMLLLIDDTSKWENCELRDEILTLRSGSTQRNVSFNSGKSCFRFTLIMYLLNEILRRLIAGITCTLRELYYQDPELCEKQINLSNALKDICSFLRASPWELGVLSSSKGLIAGSLLIILRDNEIIDCSAFQSIGFLLPIDITEIELISSQAEFVLLVEKDTVFEKLLQQNIFRKLQKEIILITGKGYPDVNTRLMINKIWNTFKIPIYALVDADPFGIEIMLIYRYGSKEMCHNAQYLACPKIQWIGLYPSEIELLSIPSIPLKPEDTKRIQDLFKRPYLNESVRKELQIMLQTNKKAEIEGISSFSLNYLIDNYIPNKIAKNIFI